jgi:hypothetical protein
VPSTTASTFVDVERGSPALSLQEVRAVTSSTDRFCIVALSAPIEEIGTGCGCCSEEKSIINSIKFVRDSVIQITNKKEENKSLLEHLI